MSTTPATHRRVITRKVVDWAAWDWGSAAFNAVATTFVFTTYLTRDGRDVAQQRHDDRGPVHCAARPDHRPAR